jgi:predicted transcriptional regulator
MNSSQPSCQLSREQEPVAWELACERLNESFINFHCLIKKEQELHESRPARVREFTWVFSTLVTRTKAGCMRIDKRKFTWEFSQLSLLDQKRTRVAREPTSESLHESFLNFHCLIKREQELHESWQARVYMRVFSTFIAWSNENKSCMRVDKREFTWEFSQLSLRLIKREQELHESWQARVYMKVFSTFIHWSNENKSCMRVDKREFTWEFSQLSLLDQTRTRVAWELTSESLHESFLNFHCLIKRGQELHESWQARVYMRVFSTFIAWSNEDKSCMRVDKQEFTCEFSQLSLLDQTRTRVAWELTSKSLHESFLNFVFYTLLSYSPNIPPHA